MTADSVPPVLAASCSGVRLAGPGDRVAGVQPSYAAAPASADEASAVLRAAAGLGLAVLPRGNGSRVSWGSPPSRCDLVIETTRMDRVLEHAAGDLVARMQAGASVGYLAGVLRAAGQRLALDPPSAGGEPGTGTVGGMLATGVAGPLRLRYGTPRDLLIGITVILADGTIAKAGGKVVKNVAGYDIGKLFAGSCGTLGLITEAVFRLHPLPAASAFVVGDCADPDAAGRVMAAVAQSPLAPSAAEIDWPASDAPIRVGVLLEGDPAGAAERAERMRGLLSGLLSAEAVISAAPPPWWGLGAAAAGDGTVIRIAFWAAELARVLAASRAAAAAAGLDPAVSGSAAAGVLHAAVPAGAEPAAVAGFLRELRAAIGAGGDRHAGDGYAGNRADSNQPDSNRPDSNQPDSNRPDSNRAADTGLPSRASAVVLHAPPGVRDIVDMCGPVPALGLMRAVKERFDPEHRMAPGRLAGGI
jgi:glycolate oxidase FAD binding subunit